jgi:hypothetical protein
MPRLLKGPLALLCLLCCLASAFGSPDATSRGPIVVVNGVEVFRIRASVGGIRPATRATIVAAALASSDEDEVVRIEKGEAAYSIFVGDVRCMDVTKADAKAGKSTMAGLARVWASEISAALRLPPVKVASGSVELPVGGSRVVKLVGSGLRSAQVGVNGDRVSARLVENGVEVKALALGASSVVIDAGGYVEAINVTVRPYAADFPQTLVAEVVGSPAAQSAVSGAIETALKTHLKAHPLARLTYKIPNASRLPIGEARTVVVPVKASAPETFAASGKVNVLVRNVPVNRTPDAELWYSNNPETVRKAQPLFSATLESARPARLLYHHVNATDYPLFLRVQLVNNSDEAAKVVVMPGDTPPDKNPVRAGLVAAQQYFQAWISGSGEVVSVPPRSTLPITLRRLGPGQTSSGLCGVRLIDGPASVLVRTDAYPPFPLDRKWESALTSTTPWREVGCPPITMFDSAPYTLSEHVYPNPQKLETVRYVVGGRYGFVRIGQRAIIRQDQNSRLEGNFGVIYNIKGEVVNPTDKPTQIEVVFEASAGYSGGLFALDGSLIRTNLLQPKAESQITKFSVPPGGSKSFEMFTIPLSGSSYPATITVRPITRRIATSEKANR